MTDILMHTLERYFAVETGNEFTDEVAEALTRVVIRNGRLVLRDPGNYDAMSEIMWCAAVSHNDFTGLGRPRDFAVHQLGHAIGAIYDKNHGETISALWESWARYVLHKDPAQFARYAKNVWGAEGAEAGIEATVRFLQEIKMPVSFSELGIGILPETALDTLAFTCTYHNTRTVGKFVLLGYDDIRRIYSLANK